MLNVRCCADACYIPGRSVRLKFLMELVSRVLRGCAYGTAFGMCSPSGAPLDVCLFMCACTEVGRCSSNRVLIVGSMYVCTCTAFGICNPSGAPLDLCTFMCSCMEVGRYSPSRVLIVVSTCGCACTAFGMYGPSGVRANVGVRMPICCSPCAVRAVYPKSVACVVYPLHATDVDLLSNAPTVRKGACVDLHLVYERAQCLALAA